MAQCILCGEKGLFLSVSGNKLCKRCDPVVVKDVQQRSQIINDCRKTITKRINAKLKLSYCDRLIENAKDLIDYERKGIPTIAPLPSEFVSEYGSYREQIILADQFIFEDIKEKLHKFLGTGKNAIIIILDTETNGIDAKYSVLSCSAIKYEIDVQTYTMTEVERFDRYYYPYEDFEKEAVKINHLTKDEITKRRSTATYLEHFIKDRGFDKFCDKVLRFVAHNIEFDLKFIPFIRGKKHFCTMKTNTEVVAAKYLEWKNEYKYPTLAETASFYNISYSEDNLHYSMDDSELVAKIFEKMLERAKSLKVKSSCPYCGFQLEKKPKKKTECPSCGNSIYVRTHPAIGLKILAIKELASEIDAFWRG